MAIAPGSGNRSLCIVLVQDAVVAEDISMELADVYPGAAVRRVKTLEDVVTIAAGPDAIDAAVLQVRRGMQDWPVAVELVAASGAKIVLMGEPEELDDHRNGWPILTRPFGREALLSVLRT